MSETALVKYEAAKKALAAAHRVDEVKSIRDKAVAMQAYARQAKDTQLITYATEIRLRSERRAGELLRDMGKRGERHSGRAHTDRVGSRAATPRSEPTLANLGVTKTQSSRWQRLAGEPAAVFERRVEQANRNSVAAINKATNPVRAKQSRNGRGFAEAEKAWLAAGSTRESFLEFVAELPTSEHNKWRAIITTIMETCSSALSELA